MKFFQLNQAPIRQMRDLQKIQFSQMLVLTGTVPANSETLLSATVSAQGHFVCEKITGGFDTLTDTGAVEDDGVCRLSGLLRDGAQNLPLFSDYIPLSLILTPGRQRSDAATNNLTTAPAPQALFYPLDLNYTFTANSQIFLNVKSSSNVDQTVTIIFHGYRVAVDLGRK